MSVEKSYLWLVECAQARMPDDSLHRMWLPAARHGPWAPLCSAVKNTCVGLHSCPHTRMACAQKRHGAVCVRAAAGAHKFPSRAPRRCQPLHGCRRPRAPLAWMQYAQAAGGCCPRRAPPQCMCPAPQQRARAEMSSWFTHIRCSTRRLPAPSPLQKLPAC